MDERFNDRFPKLERYMKGVAIAAEKQSRYHDRDDIFQELSILLLKLCRRYPDVDENQFRGMFVRSISNLLSSMFRRKKVKENIVVASREDSDRGEIGWTEHDYEVAIDEVLGGLDDDLAKVVRGLTSAPTAPDEKLYRRGSRKAYAAVQASLA